MSRPPLTPSEAEAALGFELLSGRKREEEATGPPALPNKLREIDLTLRREREWVADPLELAAYIEADGLSDEGLRGRYGAGGLFVAAEALYAQAGSGQALERRRSGPAPRFPWVMVQRGPLYLLPGLSGLLLAYAFESRANAAGVTDAFLFASAFGWGHSMLLASVRYAEPFGVPGRALRLAVLLGGAAGLVGGAVVAGVLGRGGATGVVWAALLGGAVALAGGSAGTLLALGARAQAAVAFVPALLLAGAAFLRPEPWLELCALALLAALPLTLCWAATRSPGELPARWGSLRPGLGLAAYGWAVALAFVALSARVGGWALLPVVLSAGLLEALVWNVQERLQHAAREVGDVAQLARRGLGAVLLAALVFGVWLLALAAALDLLPPPAPALTRPTLLAMPAFGAALLLSTWLANHRREPILTGAWLAFGLLAAFGVPALWLAPLLTLGLFPLTALTLRDLRSYL